jgi:two-component system nitrogen regulation sensor histidine kinase GlnL
MARLSPQQILENLTAAVLTVDENLCVTYINPAGEMLFELSANHVIGKSIAMFVGNEPALMDNLREGLSSGKLLTNRGVRLELPMGRRVTVDYTVAPIWDATGSEVVLLEMESVERHSRLVREEAMLDQHAANRAVLRGVAHEIKNPLGGLRGAAQLLERELGDQDLTEYTRIIIHEADRLRSLVDRMMGSSRPFKTKAVNIHQICEHVRTLISAEFGFGMDFQRDYDTSLPDVQADPDQITQAVLNLVRNAAQALEGKGRIVLRTRVERHFTIGQLQHRLTVRLDVEDNGPGIPEGTVEHIFFPMVTHRAEGTGLGLSIAQDIVSRHGGVIDCTSRPGLTVFSIYLPVVENGNGK